MITKQIAFTDVNTTAMVEETLAAPIEKQVLVKTAFSTISCGTERANLSGNLIYTENGVPMFPRFGGYSSSGVVAAVGNEVESVQPGDNVVVSWGRHSVYNLVDEANVVKFDAGEISMQEAALFHICTFPLAAIRKTRLEAGESVLVMGLGILGLFAVQLAKVAGGVPVVAADPVESRRALALKFGADYALDPTQDGFSSEVKRLTGRGPNVAVEVTGVGAGLNECLDCMARYGRVALLGCTRDSNFSVDYYLKVHFPGISLIGAHTAARPDCESYPGHFTQHDDVESMIKLCRYGRVNLKNAVCETHSPHEYEEIYRRVIHDRDFPPIVQFDWSAL